MDTLAEGIESIRLACTLVLLIPALGIVLLGRRRTALVAIWIATVTAVAWFRFAGWFDLASSGVVHVGAGVALIGLAVTAWKRQDLLTDVVVTGLAGVIAAWTWVPCVGRQLGQILNNAQTAPGQQLLPTALFMSGTFLPLIMIAAAGVAVPAIGDRLDHPVVRGAGLVIVFAVGALVSLTLFDDLAGELARRSSF